MASAELITKTYGKCGFPILIGHNAQHIQSTFGIIIGNSAIGCGERPIAIGTSASASHFAVAVGSNAVSNFNGVAIGPGAGTGCNGVAIGGVQNNTNELTVKSGHGCFKITGSHISFRIGSCTACVNGASFLCFLRREV